ncbi:cytochrome P450 [Auriscalpium vulgare]|uniref:Cytochrome P450 n=1 Tax=Auriscalpium vulgare TaxID=40419 RepID=A0ACB8RTN4_9AGAM|nr:cytochrome P450 [Auriscalpium vulgare]
MTALTALVSLCLTFVIYRLAKRLVAPQSPLARISGPPKEHWLKGNLHKLFKDGLSYNLALQEEFGGAVRIYGLFGEEQLYVSDPLALQHIVGRDQHIYEETDMFIMGNKIILGEGLVSTLGEQHRKQRKMLNPVFSFANMRVMLPIIAPIADKLRARLLEQLPSDGSHEVNLLPWISRGALEYICQAGLGYSFNALEPSQNHEYTEAIKSLAPTFLRILLLRPLVPVIVRNFSLYWRNKLVDWLPIAPMKELRRLVLVMDRCCRDIFFEKKQAFSRLGGNEKSNTVNERDVGARMMDKDIMSILLRANASSSQADGLTESEILGQMNTIVVAGFDTTTSATCRILHILATKPDVQNRLRREIRQGKLEYRASQGLSDEHGWEDVHLPYDSLMALPYLDAVVRETLRVHPPTSLLGRTTRQGTTLPLSRPVRSTSGEEITSIAMPSGTNIIISILAANHNKEVWGPDASVWRPERWLNSSGERVGANSISQEAAAANNGDIKYPGVYSSMMTFLGGGRACIGFKFAEMEMKQVIASLISVMHFSPPEIYWRMDGFQVPVLRSPTGIDTEAQMPLSIRLVRDTDFAG